jgi:hypothetical protein
MGEIFLQDAGVVGSRPRRPFLRLDLVLSNQTRHLQKWNELFRNSTLRQLGMTLTKPACCMRLEQRRLQPVTVGRDRHFSPDK